MWEYVIDVRKYFFFNMLSPKHTQSKQREVREVNNGLDLLYNKSLKGSPVSTQRCFDAHLTSKTFKKR